MKNYKTILILASLISSLVYNEIFASQNDPYAYKEIKAELASEKNLIHCNRIIGLLSDLLKEQKRVFTKKIETGKNETALMMEEVINEAAFFASQDDYEKAFKSLDNAHEIVMESIIKMRPKGALN